jgi:FAD:protein FMN transferase
MKRGLAKATGRGLGSSVEVVVSEGAKLESAQKAVAAVVAAVDLAASRFRSDSEISLLNGADGQEVEISVLFTQLLLGALEGARRSAGAVDPTVGEALRRVGYDTDFGLVAKEGEAIEVKAGAAAGWTRVNLNVEQRRVRVPKGVSLDLGASAKAMACDMAAKAALEAMGKGGALVSLGGDIAVAGVAPEEGWVIQVSEDSAEEISEAAEKIAIWSGGVATSSVKARQWNRGGVVWHHIIDPQTGLSGSGRWRSASVVGSSCWEANIAATATLVMGERARDWLEKQQLAARLVDREGKILRLGGWPEGKGEELGLG